MSLFFIYTPPVELPSMGLELGWKFNYNKIVRLFKSMFSYNLTDKVRSIFKRNKRKKVDVEEIANRIKANKN